eukprot:m.20346 g.20346  ORF g.20346 m.20346 type:complete len:548 (-) comp5243_c0_seq1:28-1671(-)
MKVAFVVCCLFAYLCVVFGGDAAITEVDTEYGRIKGDYEAEYKLTGYYGIPFAAPPVGNLRLHPPVAPTPWSGTKECRVDKFFRMCPQFHASKQEFAGNEDCLYMNVYVPEEAAKVPLPVMFWIYGGGFDVGDGYEFGWYRGKNLASKEQVIVVEFNYRLGALGFLGIEELRASNSNSTTGNFGTQDQLFALQFIKRNIAKFGGDPSRITIFGESAGAMSVCWHVVNTESRGLFQAAIMESGTCSSPEFFISPSRAQVFGDEFLKKVGCLGSSDVVACLRGLKTSDFFMAPSDWPLGNSTAPPLAPIMPWGPVIDGTQIGLLDRPINLMNAGQFARVPMYIGTNHDEGTIFVPTMPKIDPSIKWPIQPEQFEPLLLHFFNQTGVDALLNLYPASDYKDTDDRLAYLCRDYFFVCPTRQALLALTKYNVSGYSYQFNMHLGNWIDYDILGNYHTSELSFVFDNQWPPLVHDFDEKEKRMADTFTLYWTNLAKFGDPNHNLGKDQAVWPRFTSGNEYYVNMDVPVTVSEDLVKDRCLAWESISAWYAHM